MTPSTVTSTARPPADAFVRRRARARRDIAWHSYYISPIDFDPDRLIGHHLRIALGEIGPAVRRSFFIRYWEGELQLRLRLRTSLSTAQTVVVPALERMAEAYNEDSSRTSTREGAESDDPAQVHVVPYDRTAHYFGESRNSVYAELLNELTSTLALRVLAPRPPRPVVYIALLGFLDAVVQEAFGEGTMAAIERSVAFAEEASGDHEPLPEAPLERLWPAAKRAGAPLIAAPEFAMLARLLRRTADRANPFVATHALHLLCNKLGVLLPAERHLFLTMARAREAFGPSPCAA